VRRLTARVGVVTRYTLTCSLTHSFSLLGPAYLCLTHSLTYSAHSPTPFQSPSLAVLSSVSFTHSHTHSALFALLTFVILTHAFTHSLIQVTHFQPLTEPLLPCSRVLHLYLAHLLTHSLPRLPPSHSPSLALLLGLAGRELVFHSPSLALLTCVALNHLLAQPPFPCEPVSLTHPTLPCLLLSHSLLSHSLTHSLTHSINH
jgi:hypothetical protein